MFPVSNVIDDNTFVTVLPQASKVVVKIFETPRTYELDEEEVLVSFDEVKSLEKVREIKDDMTH